MKIGVTVCGILFAALTVQAATEVTVATERGPVVLSSFAEDSLRVTRGAKVSPELVFTATADRDLAVRESESLAVVSSGALVAAIDKKTGLVSFQRGGRTILSDTAPIPVFIRTGFENQL